MFTWLVMAFLLGPPQRSAGVSNVQGRDARESTVSSGENVYITWTVDTATTGATYDISVDDGPWGCLRPDDVASDDDAE